MKYILCRVSFLSIFLFFSLFFPQLVFAQVVINEIYPNPNTGDKEWVELFNSGTESVDISKWKIKDSASHSLTVSDNQILSAGQFSVWEFDGSILNNDKDTVIVEKFISEGNYQQIDSHEYFSSNTNSDKGRSFCRIPDGGNWSSSTSDSTRGSKNSISPTPTIEPTSTPTPTFTPVPTQTLTPKPTSTSTPIANNTSTPTSTSTTAPTSTPVPNISNISITEVYPYPESGGEEWVEIYNGNESSVTLENWYFTDSSENKRNIPKTMISSKSFVAIGFTSGFLNNGGDSLNLYDGSGVKKDSISAYGSMKVDTSWIKYSGSWCVAKNVTRDSVNSSCISSDSTPPDEEGETPTGSVSKKSASNDKITEDKIDENDSVTQTPDGEKKVVKAKKSEKEASVAGVTTENISLPSNTKYWVILAGLVGLLFIGVGCYPVIEPYIEKWKKKKYENL